MIEPYIRKRTEDLSFVQLSPEAMKVNNYKLPEEGLYVPILTVDLADKIKTKRADEIITARGIVDGMIYLLGIDPNFKYKDEYVKFLYAVNPDIEKQISYEAANFIEKGKPIEGIIHLRALTLLSSKNVNYLFNYALGLLNYADDNLNIKSKTYKDFRLEATNYFEKVLDIDEGFSLAYYHLGFLYLDNKQFKKAKLYWEKYLQLDEKGELNNQIKQILLDIEDKAKYEKGYEAVLAGRAEEGLSLLLGLEETYKDWWNLLFFIGLAYRQLGQHKDAIIYFERLLILEENQVDALAELGLCYGSINDFNKSIQYFSKALEVGGENNEILCNLAMVYMEIGDYKKAKDHLDHSLYLKPDDEITKSCYARLNKLMTSKGM